MGFVEVNSPHWGLDLYKSMARIRISETLAANFYLENKIFSFVHFCIGQELAPAAFGIMVAKDDRVFGNHRSHGHFLGLGGSPFEMFSEMLGKSTGTSSGKGGSMHLFDPKIGFWGTSPILSSALPIAAGSAWSQKLEGTQGVTIAYTGDGASEEGNFYETLNVASLWELPLVIVLENNLYSVNSPITSRRGKDFSMRKLVESFGIEYYSADGTDPIKSIETFQKSYLHTKRERKPAVIEVRAYRHLAHSSPLRDDSLGYRLEDTEHERAINDPIRKLELYLMRNGFSKQYLTELWAKLEADLADNLAEAVASPDPNPSELFSGLYA